MVTIPTYEVGKPEKNPMFLEKRVYQGSSGVVYPYPVIETMSDEKVDKEYLAICHGTPPQCGVLEDLLWKDSKRNKVFVVSRVRSGVKKAQLQYQVITGSHDETTLIHIRLGTGRSHQIRVQFASRGYPLLGDHKYGARDSLTQPRLFACRLAFPWHGKLQTFEALPEWAGIASLPNPLPGPPDQ